MKRQLRNSVNSCHARIILLSSGGSCNRGIAQCVGRSPQWVRIILHRFNDGGIADDIVKNAPATEDHFFLVPKVVE